MFRQSIIIHLQPQTFSHRRHILELVHPVEAIDLFLFASPEIILVHQIVKLMMTCHFPFFMRFQFLMTFWLHLCMTTFTDCIATTISISPHCLLAHENRIGSLKGDCFLQIELHWLPNILRYNLIILKEIQRYCWSCHSNRSNS